MLFPGKPKKKKKEREKQNYRGQSLDTENETKGLQEPWGCWILHKEFCSTTPKIGVTGPRSASAVCGVTLQFMSKLGKQWNKCAAIRLSVCVGLA